MISNRLAQDFLSFSGAQGCVFTLIPGLPSNFVILGFQNSISMRYILLILLATISLNLHAQDFSIGNTHLEFTDPERNDRSIPVEVYYPADTTGEDVALTARSNKKFPLLIFTHGYISKIKSYKNIREMLVPYGYIVVFPDTETGVFADHPDLAKDIVFLAKRFPDLTDDKESLFQGRIDTSLCLMGHSMGGGCSFLAAEMLESVNGIVTLAAYDTDPSSIEACSRITAPALLFGGSKDPVTRPENHQIPMYDSLISEHKTFINIIGGSHCQMSDQHKTCKLTELLLFSTPDISRKKQHKIMKKFMLSWLDYFMKGEEDSIEEFETLLMEVDPISFARNWRE